MSEQDKPSKSSETMPSTSKSISNMTRIQRNVAEKQRRDKLNGYISELANIVPMVSMSSKRLDKTSILRLSAAHLRLSKSPLSGTKKLKKTFKWCPSFLTAQQVREILESVDGFLIVTSSSGKILFTSGSVERYLGHQNIDMIGHSLFVFIHPEDLDAVKEEMERLLAASLKCDDSKPAPRCSFRCRMKEKGQPRSEVATYQFVHFAGDMTISNDEEESNKNIKSTAIVTHIFKAFVRVIEANPYNQLSLEDACADEYVTRHSLDGTIIFADHRLSTITGHLPQEVISFSAYKYILPEDISIALFAHHLMFSSDKGTGMVVYRLRTRDEKYVYLKSVGCLQFDRATSQVDHFVCVNQHLSDAEGEAQLKYFVDRFIPHIRGSSELTLFESVKALQVTGLKTPNSIGGIKETLRFNKLSTLDDPKIVQSDIIKSHNLHNSEASKVTFVHSSSLSESLNSEISYNSSSLKSVDTTRQLSSPMNSFLSKNNSIEAKSDSKDVQYKGKSTFTKIDGVNKKRRANGNVAIQMTVSDVKPIANYEKSISDETLLSSQMEMQSSEGCVSLQAQNISIKREMSSTVNNLSNNVFNAETKRLHCENEAEFSSNFKELSNHTNSQKIKNCVSEQMHVSAVTISNNLEAGTFQISHTDDLCNKHDDYSTKKEYDVKVSQDFKTTNATSKCNMGSENFPGVKSNILLSTGSVLYNNDSKRKTLKPVIGESNEFIKLGNDSFVTNKVTSDSSQLSANINDVVMETNLWPAETSSESSASNAVSEETFTSSVEGCGEDPNLYFMPEEEMKDYLESSDDISSILNSSLPFDDSSLPSVDGWSECFRPENVISTSNAEVSVHVKTTNNH